jgi:hypothetical protein
MIFVKSTQRANMLGGLLKDARFPCEVLHGGMKMPERQAIMKKFKESPNEVRWLLAPVSTCLASVSHSQHICFVRSCAVIRARAQRFSCKHDRPGGSEQHWQHCERCVIAAVDISVLEAR